MAEALQENEVTCELLVISNGEQATTFLDDIDAGRQSCPDLFILDLNLPRRPGTELLERMRSCGTCKHVPVVILTSSDSQKDKDAVAKFSPARYLRKPLTLQAFLQLGAIFKDLLKSQI